MEEVHYREFSKAQLALLHAAETLFAERGLKAVADREIARAAGQKNNSAVQYHFESRNKFEQALLDYRILPLNALRLQQIQAIKEEAEFDVLLSAWMQASIKQITQFSGQSRIFNLLEQYRLLGLHEDMQLNPVRWQAVKLFQDKMQHAPMFVSLAKPLNKTIEEPEFEEQDNMLHVCMNAAFAEWENDFATNKNSKQLQSRSQALLDLLLTGLRG